MDKSAIKVDFLKEILARKRTLFGQFSDHLTKLDKHEAWKEVHAVAQALGLVNSAKDFAYTRDVVWQNLKKAAMKKRDNSKKTGSGGGVEAKFTPIDIIIFEIIGKETPVMDGLPIPESYFKEPPPPPPITDEQLIPDTDHHTLHHSSNTQKNNQNKSKKRLRKTTAIEDDIEQLRIKKLKLSIELLKKENILKELEIIKLKKELKLSDKPVKEVIVEDIIEEVEEELPLSMQYEEEEYLEDNENDLGIWP